MLVYLKPPPTCMQHLHTRHAQQTRFSPLHVPDPGRSSTDGPGTISGPSHSQCGKNCGVEARDACPEESTPAPHCLKNNTNGEAMPGMEQYLRRSRRIVSNQTNRIVSLHLPVTFCIPCTAKEHRAAVFPGPATRIVCSFGLVEVKKKERKKEEKKESPTTRGRVDLVAHVESLRGDGEHCRAYSSRRELETGRQWGGWETGLKKNSRLDCHGWVSSSSLISLFPSRPIIKD